MILNSLKAVGAARMLAITGAAVAIALAFWVYGVPGQAMANGPQSAQAPTSAAQFATRTSTGGQVTLKATWQGAAGGPVFGVVMDTHSVNLDSVDLQQMATLRVDGGTEIKPIQWDAPKGDHHRGGTLTFPATGSDGSPVIGPKAQAIELIVRKLASVPERVLEWQQWPQETRSS